MLFLSVEDFFEKAAKAERLSPEEANECARLSREGDAAARERLIASLLGVIASPIRRLSPAWQTLDTVYAVLADAEKVVDQCDFSRGIHDFAGYLSLFVRRQVTRHVANSSI